MLPLPRLLLPRITRTTLPRAIAPFRSFTTAPKLLNKPAYPIMTNDHNTRDVRPEEKPAVNKNRMDRPPYSLSDDNRDFRKVYDGGCFCGTVKFEVACEKPLDAKFCHCSTCQRLHGAPFQWAAIVDKTAVHFTAGYDDLIFYNPTDRTQEYVLPCKVSCRSCRTPIMDEGRNKLLLYPTLIEFGDMHPKKKDWYPSAHIFYSRRAVDFKDGVPKWSGHKDDSELMPETLEEEKEKAPERVEKK